MQQTSTVKLPVFYQRLLTEKRDRRINKSEMTGENAFHADLFEIEDNHEASNGKKTWF